MPVNLKKASSVLIRPIILTLAIGMSNSLQAQDTSDTYDHERETEELLDQAQSESRTYFTEETSADQEGHHYADQESHHYYTEVENDDAESPSMLTFNFLFYMVYKLKFSDAVEDEPDDKVADD